MAASNSLPQPNEKRDIYEYVLFVQVSLFSRNILIPGNLPMKWITQQWGTFSPLEFKASATTWHRCIFAIFFSWKQISILFDLG